MGVRSYSQSCALAVALDTVGSRWTMLLLRDLLAGPARFVDLQRGLAGIPPSLLTTRLRDLEDAGLVERSDGPYGASLYRLTDRGLAIRPALEELGKFGLTLGVPVVDPDEPGNLRFLGLALGAILRQALPVAAAVTLGLQIEDEWFVIHLDEDDITVDYRQPDAGTSAVRLPYRAVADVLNNRQPPASLRGSARSIEAADPAIDQLIDLLTAAIPSHPG